MFTDPYERPQATGPTTDHYRRLLDEKSAVTNLQHQEDLNTAFNSMASSAGAVLLGVLWLGVGLYFGRLFYYPFFLIGGGFIGFVSAIGFYFRIA